MAAQPGVIRPIHPQRIPNGYLLTSSTEVQARTPDPSQAAFHPAQTTLYNTPVNTRTDIEKRVDLQMFVYHDVRINSHLTPSIYASNGNHDWVDSDPNSPHRATQEAGAARAKCLVSSRLSRSKARSFRVFKAIVPQIVGLFGTPQEWKTATVQEREAVFNAIYLADEYSIISATVGDLMCATVNFDAIFLNNTYFPSSHSTFNTIPVLRDYCRYYFVTTCEIVYQSYVVNPGTGVHRTNATESWGYSWNNFNYWYLRNNGVFFPIDIFITENIPIRGH